MFVCHIACKDTNLIPKFQTFYLFICFFTQNMTLSFVTFVTCHDREGGANRDGLCDFRPQIEKKAAQDERNVLREARNIAYRPDIRNLVLGVLASGFCGYT
jgi:hypothetical protein